MSQLTIENKKNLRDLAERLSNQSYANGKAEIIEEIVKYAEDNFCVKPKTFKQKVSYWIKGFFSGLLIYSVHYIGIAFLLWLCFKLWFPLPYITCFGIFATLRLLYVNVTKMSKTKNKRLMKKWRAKS